MAIEITSRHIDVTPEVKAFAGDKAAMIAEEFPQVENIHVILDRRGYDTIAEIVVQGKNKLRIEASDRAEAITAAIDSAAEKIVNRLRKAKEKVVERRNTAK